MPLLTAGDIIGRRASAALTASLDGPRRLAERELAATAARLRVALAQGPEAQLAG